MNNTIDREHIIGVMLNRIAKMNNYYVQFGLEEINPIEFLQGAENLTDQQLHLHYQVFLDATADTDEELKALKL